MQEHLIHQIDRDRLPRHIAIIMDGNGRWAAGKGMPRVEGHRAGAQAVRDTGEAAAELRISNFLLWQIAYAEIWTTETLWPDFRRQHLWQAIVDYQSRERRFGAVAVNANGMASSKGAGRP